jgi:hypothetical protein
VLERMANSLPLLWAWETLVVTISTSMQRKDERRSVTVLH